MSNELVIGLLMSQGHAYYRRILSGIAEYAERHPHWRFLSTEHAIGPQVRRLLQRADAVIVSIESPAWYQLLKRASVPVVNVGCVVPDLPIPRVGVNNQRVGELAAEHFLQRGLQSFGFVGHSRFRYSTEREQAFCKTLSAAGYSTSVWHCDHLSTFDNTGRKTMLNGRVKNWLSELPRPTGILAAFDSWAADLLQFCHEIQIDVPDELAVLGVDDDDVYCETARPRLSSVINPARSIGLCAAEQLDRLVAARQRFMKEDLLIDPPGIATRQSTDILAIDDADVAASLRFIRENSHRQIAISDVERIVNISRRALERKFVDLVGITLGEEIRRTRLERAKRLLTNSQLSIADVARQSGFKDFRHLSVTFKQKLTMTPTQYRQQFRRSDSMQPLAASSGPGRRS